MKPRQELAIFFIFLLSTSALARDLPAKHRQTQLQQRVKRQSESAINAIMQMALKYAPLLINTFVSGGGSGGGLADLAASFLGGGGAGAAAAKPAVDTKVTAVTPSKNDKIGAGVAEKADIFSWSNLLAMGVKIALSLVSSYASGNIDRNGDTVSPMQTVLGTVISAMTGSEDPAEVATMAKQATEVFGLLGTLVDALRTSFLS